MDRKFSFSIDEFYHVYSRGVEKRIIFKDENDYNRFIKLLWVSNHGQPTVFREILKGLASKDIFDFPADQSLVDIGAYCLMPNHFHLLLHEKKENGISLFMQKLLTAYSKYFNIKYERKGRLFEGIFNAAHLNDDSYLQYIYSYIHLNPVKLIYPNWKEEFAGKKFDLKKSSEFVKKYKYHSYYDYAVGERKETKILNKSAFPEYFKDQNDFKETLDFWLNYDNEMLTKCW